MFGWFGRRRADVVAEFTRHICEQRPAWRVGDVSDGMLRMELPGGVPLRLSVERIRETVEAEPGGPSKRVAAYARLVELLDEVIEQTRPLTLERDRERLRPRIVSPDQYSAMKRGMAPVGRALPELGLWVVYVVDSKNSVAYLMMKQLASLGIDEDALHEIAMENLRRDSVHEAVRSVVEGKTAVSIKQLDSYDAARLLLVPDCLNGDEAVAACIPDRDTLFLCPAPRDAAGWEQLAAVARAPAGDRLILDRPVRVTRRRFEAM